MREFTRTGRVIATLGVYDEDLVDGNGFFQVHLPPCRATVAGRRYRAPLSIHGFGGARLIVRVRALGRILANCNVDPTGEDTDLAH